MCAMERYAHALALCASDKLGDIAACFVFLSFFHFIAHFIRVDTCVSSADLLFLLLIYFFFLFKTVLPTGWTNLTLAIDSSILLRNSFLFNRIADLSHTRAKIK